MKILITGALGTVGLPLFEKLNSSGSNLVTGLDINYTHKENIFRCDISKFRQLENSIAKSNPEIVYNLAAEFGRWNGENHYENVWETNVIGLKHLLKLQETYGFRIVHFSSSEVYGDYPEIMSESVMDKVPIQQMNDYAISKWVNELQILNAQEFLKANHEKKKSENHLRNEIPPPILDDLVKLDIVRVRLFNTYGPGEYFHPFRSAICKFIYAAITGKEFTVHQGHNRSHTYISDAVHALANISTNFVPGEVYNIGSDNLATMEHVAELVVEHSGCSPSLLKLADSEPNTTTTKVVDISTARRDLDLSDSVSLNEGIKNTVKWMRSVYS